MSDTSRERVAGPRPGRVERVIRAGMTTGGLAALFCVALGFGGALHPVCDSLAVIRLPMALLGMALLLPAPRMVFWPGLILGALAMMSVLWPKLIPGTPGPVTIYQKNLFFILADPAPIVADIIARQPDIVTLQEVGPAGLAVLDALADGYPTQAICPAGTVGRVAVATHWPALGDALCLHHHGFVAQKVQSPHGPVWLVSQHLHWPWPIGQAEQVDRLEQVYRDFDAPVLLAGDFNMVPWGSSVERLAQATGTILSGPAAPTYYVWGRVPLPIDHILAGGGTAEVLPLLGSDHHGVFARVFLP